MVQDFELFGQKTESNFKKTGKVCSCSVYNFTFIMENSCGNEFCGSTYRILIKL